MALLGVTPLDLPVVSYNSNGVVNYDSTSNAFSLAATPLSIETQTTPFGLFFSGDVDINIEVDETGALVGGTAGDDFILIGDVDTTGDFVADTSGVLLTGEVLGFGFEDSGGTTDLYDFRFVLTGGALAGDFIGKDIGVTTTSETSGFVGDFNVDFSGNAKGNIGAIDPLVVANSSIHGLVWEDFNNDGEVNFNEKVIEGVTVQLLDENGVFITDTTTDSQGLYWFMGLEAGTYTVMELQPTGFLDGMDVVGEIDGSPVGDNSINDKITDIVLPEDTAGDGYNFGERPEDGGVVTGGQTATIGYWQNKNGQRLIKSLNGGSSSTDLGNWLAATLPNMLGDDGDAVVNPYDLTGKTNVEVAALYKKMFKQNLRKQGLVESGPRHAESQFFATALAVYVTDSTLAGTTATSFGFTVTTDGTGTNVFNVGDNGAAFGVADNTYVQVLDLLMAADAQSDESLLYDLNDDGDVGVTDAGAVDSALEVIFRQMSNEIFSGINEQGDI